MLRKAVFPGEYLQGVGAMRELPALMAAFGQRGVILASPSARERLSALTGDDSRAAGCPVEIFGGECCESEVERLSRVVADHRAEVVVGAGGGKAIDTAKIVADRAGLPVIIVPTIASTDAPCSRCAVVYSADGVFDSVLYQKRNPAAVLVDVGVIAAAPVRFLVAGMGDALATWFEARSCERTGSPNECGGRGTAVGLHIARLCHETLLKYGWPAKLAGERHLATPALERIVEANILLSGIGFESAGLAAAHAIHNGLTVLAETHSAFHGEKVAFGVLAGLQLTDADGQESAEVYAFCEAVGLPTTLGEIGAGGVERDRLRQAAAAACAPGQSIHHEAGPICPERVLEAMLAADAIGQARRQGQRFPR